MSLNINVHLVRQAKRPDGRVGSRLEARRQERQTDSGVLGLIRGWLRAPVVETDEHTGKPNPPRKSDGKGKPQGGVISPLLANV